jgi:hypothetical protein
LATPVYGDYADSLVYLVTSAGILIGFNDLWQNYRVWQVSAAVVNFKEKVFDPQVWVVANHPDPVYLGLIIGGRPSLWRAWC